MSEILIEKLEAVITQFEQFNTGKINAVGKKADELKAEISSLQKSLSALQIPKEITLRNETHTAVDCRNTDIWVKIMAGVVVIFFTVTAIFCSWFYNKYKIDKAVAESNRKQQANYHWLVGYYNYMQATGAPKTTAAYKENYPLPQLK